MKMEDLSKKIDKLLKNIWFIKNNFVSLQRKREMIYYE